MTINTLLRTEKEEIDMAIIFNQQFSYLENVCESYLINYDMKLVNQVLDSYNHYKRMPMVSKDQAMFTTLKNFYLNIKNQYQERFE